MRYFLVWCGGLLLFFNALQAQAPKKYSTTDIYQAVQKLNFLGSALYIAAHPDDENTRLISYFSNELKARTGYLSITRGDGGQNLIGPELQELLGYFAPRNYWRHAEWMVGSSFLHGPMILDIRRTLRKLLKFGTKTRYCRMWFG